MNNNQDEMCVHYLVQLSPNRKEQTQDYFTNGQRLDAGGNPTSHGKPSGTDVMKGNLRDMAGV